MQSDICQSRSRHYYIQLHQQLQSLFEVTIFDGGKARTWNFSEDPNTFLQERGHLYLLKILPTRTDNQRLQLRACEFFNTIIDYSRQLESIYMGSELTAENSLSSVPRCITEIIDNCAVTAFVGVAIYANIERVQILAWMAVAKLCIISAHAAAQLFEREHQINRDNKIFQEPQSTSSTHLSYLLSIIVIFSDRLNLIGYCADVIFAVTVNGESQRSISICRTSTRVLPHMYGEIAGIFSNIL